MQKAKQSPLQGSWSQTKDPIEVPRLVHDLGSGLATPSLLCLKAYSTLLPPVSDPRWPRPRPRAWKPERQLLAASQVVAEWDTGPCSREEGTRASAPSKAHAFASEMRPDRAGSSPQAKGCPLSPLPGLRPREEGRESGVVSLPFSACWSQACLPQLMQRELGSARLQRDSPMGLRQGPTPGQSEQGIHSSLPVSQLGRDAGKGSEQGGQGFPEPCTAMTAM